MPANKDMGVTLSYVYINIIPLKGGSLMRYNFDQVINRKDTNSVKWDNNLELFGTDDVIDMWVADMDFPVPQPVIDAIKQRLEHPIFGYTFAPDSLYQAIVERMERFYNWKIKKEWIVFTPGVVNAVYAAIAALTDAGDEVILQSPVYYPFFSAIKNNGCQVVNNQLSFDGQRYTFDFDDLRTKFKNRSMFPARSHRIKALILCSPHNPVGRVWTRDELEQLAEICLENQCAIISDEIHCDLLVSDSKHIVTASLSEEIAQNTITLMAPSKTFNLAGLKASFAVIPNAEWRRKFEQARLGQGGVNLFGLVAMEAALRHGDEYLEQLREYLRGNVDFAVKYIGENIPELKVVRPEGTYLLWVDMSALGLSDQELAQFMLHKARIATDFGYIFGPGGKGFQRFNLACPRSVLTEALKRLETAVRQLRKQD